MNGTISSPISERIERYVITTNVITGIHIPHKSLPIPLLHQLSSSSSISPFSSGYSALIPFPIEVISITSPLFKFILQVSQYLFLPLQCLLILIDLFFSCGNPILIRDSFSLYSPRFFLPSFLDATACMTIALFFILSLGNVFFSSVLTRYQSVIPLNSPNRFPKWRLTLMRYSHSLNFLLIPLFFYSLQTSKLTYSEMTLQYPWIIQYPIHIVLNFTPSLKAVLLALIILSIIPMSFTLKLLFRMVHTITLRTSVTTVKTLSHDSLVYALALETVLPFASFGIPAIGLTLGLILSHSDPEWNALCFLFHSSHAFFVSIITIIFYIRYRQTPNQYISTKISHLSDHLVLPSLLSIPHNDN